MHTSASVRKQSAEFTAEYPGLYQESIWKLRHTSGGIWRLELGGVMATRRQEKVARVVKEAVSDAITHHLNDPRIEGFVSVTRVDVAPDMRRADVYLSIFGGNKAGENKTFAAIEHARSRIQSLLAPKVQSKFCPVLHFYKDEEFKKTLETMRLIDQATRELENKDLDEQDEQSE
jgi:ribosome-binding factor A